ncbi:MAG: hypothetical protein ACXADH_18245, partial [Candidatus Kariarchaeaceae archaeon]
TYFAVRAYGQIQSGFLQRATVDLTNSTFEKFKKIRVGDPSICEIISVFDSDGNRYYEVDNLAQEVIFVDTTNKNAADDGIRSILKPFATTRRFTVEQDDTGTYLQFGFGSADEDDSGVTDPASVALKMHGKNYISSKSFDPTKLMSTNKLGISPYNTELVIVFTANTVNVVNRVQFIYQDITALTNTQRNFLENSLEVNNDNPITSINVDISVDELKQRAKSHYAAQNRAVTKQDYESLVYNMPAKFGAITRANIINDPSATNRKMSLYVISQDSDGNLALAGDVVKNNLKNWINQFRAVNDQIEIMNPKIINFGIDFVVMTDKRFSQNSVLTECVEEIKALFSDKLYIGEPIYLSRIYERLNRIDGVVDVRKVTLYNKNDGSYSSVFLDFDKVLSRDGTYIETPKNAIMELKFPDLDIKGTAK